MSGPLRGDAAGGGNGDGVGPVHGAPDRGSRTARRPPRAHRTATRRRSRVWVALGFLCTAAGALAASCGLESFPEFLEQPTSPLAGGDYFQFQTLKDHNSEDDFRGFELYYKFYDPGEPGRIVDDQANIAAFDNLGTRGYRRINSSSDSLGSIVKPLIPVNPDKDRGKPFTVQIEFKNLDQAPQYPRIVVIEDSAKPLVYLAEMQRQDIRRAVTYKTLGQERVFKGFNDFFESAGVDQDITYDPDIWTEINTGQAVTLALYALSYGLYVPDNRELYSQPLFLGDITVIFPANTYPP